MNLRRQTCSNRAFLAVINAAACLLFGCGKPAPSHQTRASSPAAPPAVVPITNMVLIKAGTFMRMNRPVTLTRDFWLGKHEVTQAQFVELTGKNPSYFPDRPSCPVEKVSQQEAAAFCAALTRRERDAGRLPSHYEYRLPTEAEWEYACRAGSTNHFSFGDSEADADRFAWTAENAGGTTHPVGEKQPNAWGLYDMHGNVWEWCQDWFAEYPPGPQTDPVGAPAGKFKVFRGGGWDKDVKYARASNRFMMGPAAGINFVGFRVALAHRPAGR